MLRGGIKYIIAKHKAGEAGVSQNMDFIESVGNILHNNIATANIRIGTITAMLTTAILGS